MLLTLVLFLAAVLPARALAGQDLKLSYTSPLDNLAQPYRVYLPAAYDGSKPFPVVIALHGTGGNENTLFDDPHYQKVPMKTAADKHGLIVVSPYGRGVTEYRGIGEHDIFLVLEEVRKRFRIDESRIYLTGHSMGGTGSAYLALHYPDRFAAAAPLAAAYSFPWLAENARHVPFLWIGGAADSDFYLRGVAAGVGRMAALGYRVESVSIPGGDHYAPVQDFDRVFDWLAQHRRVAQPRDFVFVADTPRHGSAYGVSVRTMQEPGRRAVVRGQFNGGNRVALELENVAELAFQPDPMRFDPARPIEIVINGRRTFRDTVGADEEVRLTQASRVWRSQKAARVAVDVTRFRRNPVARASREFDMTGIEPALANWIADAMRAATGADLALYNRQYYRGLPIPEGSVDIVDLIQCSRPFDQYLVVVELSGRDILEILDDNVPDPKKALPMRADRPGADRLVQVSGLRYAFSRAKPASQRITWSNLDLNRRYRVALEGQVVERETMLLAGRFRKLQYRTTEIPFTMALYGYAAKSGSIDPKSEGRIREEK